MRLSIEQIALYLPISLCFGRRVSRSHFFFLQDGLNRTLKPRSARHIRNRRHLLVPCLTRRLPLSLPLAGARTQKRRSAEEERNAAAALLLLRLRSASHKLHSLPRKTYHLRLSRSHGCVKALRSPQKKKIDAAANILFLSK